MTDLKYTEEHEWISMEGSIGTVGISDYAQVQLGDVVFVEVPEIGSKRRLLENFFIEHVKFTRCNFKDMDLL